MAYTLLQRSDNVFVTLYAFGHVIDHRGGGSCPRLDAQFVTEDKIFGAQNNNSLATL